MKIYSVSTVYYYAFGAHVPKHIALRVAELPHIDIIIPDSYYDVANRLYGGEPFINEQAVPYHPKYHKCRIRKMAQKYEWSGRNDQGPPKMGASEWNRHYCRSHFDRSGNYEIGGGNLYPVLPPNVPQNYKGDNLWRTRFYYLPHMPSGGMLYQLPPNMGGVPQRNYGGMPPPNNTGMTQMQAG
ncbi:hypothetical protein LWI29_014065 [Acer saccharum]|uniref:MORF/ORRM1/DAG-like MORF domain-containing protein n=1 Tax=Acer saccharum TaxID=4024 RepID=A0AA39RWJ8_ACESA|nr:hypothetical protein LWI29_014065 [Acer saccharum]